MEYFCKSHVALAMDAGLAKSKDHKVIIERGDKKCDWSGCGTTTPETYKMTYEKGEEPTASDTASVGESTTASETPSQPTEEIPAV